MKKIYVKPMATNVAFVVNENIASSLSYEGVPGTTNMSQVEGNNCNKVFYTTDISTGLEPGVFDFNTAFEQLDDELMLEITLAMANPAHKNYETYRACFLG